MNTYQEYLDQTGEVGYVSQVIHAVCYVSGLPHAHPNELVVTENGDFGQVLSFTKDQVEILMLSGKRILVGDKVARTDTTVNIGVGNGLLGRVIDPLGNPIDSAKPIECKDKMPIETKAPGIIARQEIVKPLETGVAMSDMIVPIAKGQRELLIGDRKTGKSQFLMQTVLNQAQKGTICIYAIIGQRNLEVQRLNEFLKQKNITASSIIVASTSSQSPGLIFLTPYTAMTISEYFRDKGMDVLLILDDLTTHAKYYREITLLAKRFPGRGSYPGDIFYIHSRLLERAGNFTNGSITCIPCAETILGDLSGYIQTNIMAMTDGHIYFDIDLYNQGRRPAINPFLSVTRVGHQSQTNLGRDVSRILSGFLVEHEKMQQFMHFGAEVGENVKKILDRGEKLLMLFNQPSISIIPIPLSILLIAGLWSGVWHEVKTSVMKTQVDQILLNYQVDTEYHKQVDDFISQMSNFDDLVNVLRQNSMLLTEKMSK